MTKQKYFQSKSIPPLTSFCHREDSNTRAPNVQSGRSSDALNSFQPDILIG